jgi:multiple sugar transport system substrate-binding protein
MSKRLILLILIAAFMLPACGKKKSSPTPTPELPVAEGEAAITFAVWDWQMGDYEKLATAFQEANPDVYVKLVSINEILELDAFDVEWSDDAWARLAARADVINLDATPDVVEQGLVRDLTPFLRSDPNFQADDFYPGALESVQWDGGAWMLPTQISFDLILFDKDAFDAADLPYPQPGWTWDDFLHAARALTQRDGDAVTRWGFVQSSDNPLPFIEGRAGPVIDETTDPPTPRYDQPEVLEAARWYVDLMMKEEVMPYEEPVEQAGAVVPLGQRLIEQQQAAMWDESSLVWSFRKEQGHRGVAPYPVDSSDAHTTPIWVTGLSMSAGAQHAAAAWRWMDFIGRQAPQQGGPFIEYLPARRSVAESSGFWEQADAELAAALRYAIDHSYVTRWRTGYQAGQDALEAVFKGEKTLEEALAAAQTQAETEIEQERSTQAAATPIPTFVVAAPEKDASTHAGATTISFSPGIGAMINIQAYRDAARDFESLHPDIHVEVEMPQFMGGAFSMQSLAENYDCFQWSPEVQDPANQAAILPLKPFLDADPSFSTADFYPALLDQFTWQGQLWGLPAELQPYLIEYNKDLFDAAGVAYPALDWTLEDFSQTAIALTRGEGDTKQYGFVPQAFETNDLLLLIEQRGAQLVDKSADPPALTLNDPATVEALQWYVNLSAEYGVKPVFMADVANVTNATAVFMEYEALTREGRAAMWTSFGAVGMILVGMGAEQAQPDTGVAPLPAGSGGRSGGGTSTGYFISASAEQRQACWQWITFLTSRPDVTQGVPARRSVAESDAYRQRVGADNAAAYLASVNGVGQGSSLDVFSGESWLAVGIIWLGRAYEQAANGDMTVAEALNAAQKLADDYRACVVAQDAFADQQAWLECSKEADPNMPDFLLQMGGE